MAAGCEFICKNEDCANYETGFTITTPWPLGQISLIAKTSSLSKMDTFRESLLKMKEDGRRYACITLPNVDEVPVEGYRVQRWCPACSCIWNYDAMAQKDGETLEEVLENSDVPEACSKCEGFMLDFDRVIDEGVNCPSCNERLSQRWGRQERWRKRR